MIRSTHAATCLILSAGAALTLASCKSQTEPAAKATSPAAAQPAPQATPQTIATPPAPPAAPAPVPAMSAAIRLQGDAVATKVSESRWTSGSAVIDTVLPEGYAPPTPPGAIDIKLYPSYRRAETSGSGNVGIGMNLGFFPLFNHIKRRNIPMTSPVEMDYTGWTRDGEQPLPAPKSSPDRWTMSFLYRTPELGAAGDDPKNENIVVTDTPPRMVISIGYQGGYGFSRARAKLDELAEWIAKDGRYEVIGEPRALYYNGPEQADKLKWAEIQLPVKVK